MTKKSSDRISERKAVILRALVDNYVRTGEPVASDTIAASTGLGLSAATIRNELAALEEMGYLTQPHTSSGRVPTDIGYRRYVDSLPGRVRLREIERREIVQFFAEALADVDEILRGTTHLLSRLTSYASVAVAPSRLETKVARAELVPLGTMALLIVVFENGHIDKRVIEVPPAAQAEVDALSRQELARLGGRTVGEMGAELARRAGPGEGGEKALLQRIVAALSSIGEPGAPEAVILGGVANIAVEEAFHQRERLREIFEALERQTEILGLLKEATTTGELSVTIGRESPVTGVWDASMVAAPYGSDGHPLGTIGVVGPTRMDYASVMAAVRLVSERLSRAVEALAG